MAIGIIVDMLGVTREQYEQVRREALPDDRSPPGLLYHAAGPTPHGWLISQVWVSREALDRFYEDQLDAALQRATISIQPQVYEVVHTLQA